MKYITAIFILFFAWVQLQAQSVVKQESVTITASPVIREAGKTVYHLKPALFPAGTKTGEIINKIPTLSTADGMDILIKGHIKTELLIDGKPAPAGVLATLPVTAIKSIEIIESPNATVGGEPAGGIINIILRKDAQPGGGSLFLSAGMLRPLLMGGGNFMYSNKKLFWMVSANGQYSVQQKTIDIERSTALPGNYIQHSNTRAKPYYINTHSELFYKPDSMQQASAIIYANILGAGSGATSIATVPGNKINTVNNFDFSNRFLSGTGEYKKQLPHSRQYVITGALQDAMKLVDADNRETSLRTGKTGNRFTDTVSVRIVSLQAVIARKDKKRKITDWESGIMTRYEQARDEYSHDQLLPGEQYTTYTADSNRFYSRKTTIAAFTQLKFTARNKAQVAAGLRGEYFRQELYYPVKNQTLQWRSLQLFPSLSVYQPLKNKYDLQLNYTRRTRRPDITILSGFAYTANRAQANTGNAGLVPELSDKFSAAISRMHKGVYLDLSLYATRKARPLVEKTLDASADSSILRTIENFRQYYSGGASFSFTVPLREKLSVNGSVYAEAFRLTGREVLRQKHSGIIAGGNLNISASLKNNIGIDGYISYTNYSYEYQQITRNYPLAAISVRKTAYNDRLNISLSLMDVLNTGFNRLKQYDDGFITQLARERSRNCNFVLSLTWNFGKKPRSAGRQKTIMAEEVRERKNND